MLVGNITIIEDVSIGKVLSILVKSKRTISPKQSHYSQLKVDEFGRYLKRNQIKYG